MSGDGASFEGFLRGLSHAVLEKLDANMASGALFQSSYESIERSISSYAYAIGMSEVRLELLPRAVDQWVWRDKGRFINEVMASCPDLAEGIELAYRMLAPSPEATSDPGTEEVFTQRAVDYISTFVLALTDRLLQAAPDQQDALLDITVEEFLRDLRMESPGWDVRAYIKCLWLEMESCPLAEGIVLRRPRLDDYRDRKWVEGFSCGGPGAADVDTVGTSAGAILEMRSGPASEASVREELEAILDALLLFRVASLSKEHLDMRSRSILTSRDVVVEDEGRPPLFHAVLRKDDVEDLRTFMSTMVSLVNHHHIKRSLYVGRDTHTRNMLRIRQRYAPADGLLPEIEEEMGSSFDIVQGAVDAAFHLYRGALLDLITLEERVSKLVAGLEHLYLSPATVVDRKRAVALRASSLLEGWGFDALKVARDIREGFKVKGDLYNAAAMGMIYKEETLRLCEDLAEYLRTSLVIFYQTASVLPRDALIEATDLVVQGKELPDRVAAAFEVVFLNESVSQPYR